ncbi:tyrosine-type recombinase/integrase [Enterococcus sp. AZ109]|uniref:tyrosine-type recombinase/integrase n=1 Tax=Enterococcus sp. AZ109 TaxID=2774634 RepID=UPI003F21F7C2
MKTKEAREVLVERVIADMETELDLSQLQKLQVVMTIRMSQYSIEESKNEIIIYDETSDIAAYKQFFISKKLAGLSERTIELYMYTIDKFMRTVRKSFSEVKTNDIRLYIANRSLIDGLGSSSLDHERGCICRFFRWLHDEEYITSDPGKRVEKIKVEKRLKKAFTPIEVELLRRSAKNSKQRLVIEMLLSTGCRVSELVALEFENYDLASNACSVVGKGAKERRVFFNAKTVVAMREYLEEKPHTVGPILYGKQDGDPMTKSGIQKMTKDIGDRASIHAHPHKFRRTAATLAIKRGMSLNDVRRFLGHDDMNTTLQYLDLGDNDMKMLHDKYVN